MTQADTDTQIDYRSVEIDYSKYDKVPTKQMYDDINDTQAEIYTLQAGIDSRKGFITKVRNILAYREARTEVEGDTSNES